MCFSLFVCLGEFDLQEEKPLVYAEDGTTILTEEYNNKERQKKERWKSLGDSQRKQRHDSSDDDDDDLSPVRNRSNVPPQRHDESDDLSPVRRNRKDSSSDQDLSPVRRNRKDSSSDQDLSPVRQKRCDTADSSPKRSSKNSGKRVELEPEVLTTSEKSGLKTSAELREENEIKRRRERNSLKNLNTDVSGKDSKTVRRDKSGRRIDEKLESIKKRKAEEERLEKEEKYARWGKGLAQQDNQQQQIQDEIHEMQKPLARHKDDEDLERMLKMRERDDDPMAAYITRTSKKSSEPSKPQYNGPVVPNRFNIRPGYRWDGVDRSNGFEKLRFVEIGKRKSLSDAAYKWSVEDM